jgi:CDP-diacylglycerol--glycerol-3-phosphate 3-phosphatidyltransferase
MGATDASGPAAATVTGHPRRPGLGVANLVTLVRIGFIPFFMAALLVPDVPGGDALAAALFVVAAATDSLDGYLARARNEVTRFGAFLDPLADKLLVSGALLSLVELGRVDAWVAMVIVAREFAVTGLRLVAVGEGIVISASGLGKTKTFAQNVAIAVIVADVLDPAQNWLLAAAVVLTVWSGVTYFWAGRRVLATAVGPRVADPAED